VTNSWERGTRSFASMPRFALTVTALVSLTAFVLLSLAVARGQGPYGFEDPTFGWLKSLYPVAAWARFAKDLAAPLVAALLVVSFAIGIAKRSSYRVIAYAALAVLALLTSEYVAKPLVQRTYYAELTFPSGNVTAVCATACGMWLALFPLLGRRPRNVALVIGAAGTLLMAVAVVGALWHTPLDDLGSILLSVGIVTGGGAVFEEITARRESASTPRNTWVGKRE
jgi:hypothetical protein